MTDWFIVVGCVVVMTVVGAFAGISGTQHNIETACLKKGYVEINESVYKCTLDTEMEVINLIKKGVNG